MFVQCLHHGWVKTEFDFATFLMLYELFSSIYWNVFDYLPMSSRPVDFDISKLRIYFLTNAYKQGKFYYDPIISYQNFFIFSF